MNKHQHIAFKHPCLLDIEVLHPRFSYVHGIHSVVLTLNSGFECLENHYGGPVWHASTAMYAPIQADLIFLRQCAYRALEGVGDATRGQWEQWNEGEGVFHLRRRLTEEEQAIIGEARDIRDTDEAEKRYRAIRMVLPPELHIV